MTRILDLQKLNQSSEQNTELAGSSCSWIACGGCSTASAAGCSIEETIEFIKI